MSKGSGFGKGLLGTLMIAALAACFSVSNKEDKEKIIKSPNLIEKRLEEKVENYKTPISWKSVEDYDSFVRSKVNEYYTLDIKDMYKFYNIEREIPKYGFKAKGEEFICLDCEGATYIEDEDSIYFYSSCSEEMFKTYKRYLKERSQESIESLTERIRYFIKHEAAHAFYYNLGKKLGADYLFNVNTDEMSTLDKIQHKIVEEGVAEYMSNRGKEKEWPRVDDRDFKEMIKEENDYYVYELGFKLVNQILDMDFQEGLQELIENPLTKKDLNDLPAYRQKRIDNLLRKLKN